jgi:hypothetical protein
VKQNHTQPKETNAMNNPKPTTKRKDAAKPKGAPATPMATAVADYWQSAGCEASPLWISLNQKSTQLDQEERAHVRRYWDMGEELASLKEEVDDHNKARKGKDVPRRSFDAEAKLALGSKARVYRVQNIYDFFGKGQKKGGAKASAWPYTLSDVLEVIREMGMSQANQDRVKLPQTIMAQIDKSGDFDALLKSIGKWLEDKKAAKAKERQQDKAAAEAAKEAAQKKALSEARDKQNGKNESRAVPNGLTLNPTSRRMRSPVRKSVKWQRNSQRVTKPLSDDSSMTGL